MSESRQPGPDPLEATVRAFQSMSVPDRPPDEQVLARLGTTRDDGVPSASIPPPKWRSVLPLLLSAAVAAVLFLGGLVLFLRNNSPSESAHVDAPVAPDTAGRVAVVPPPTNKRSLGERSLERLRSLKQQVTEAQVIVVATALDSAVAPPKRPGDLPETLLRFEVKRVLKGKLADKVITTRTPTAAAEFIGKEWVVMLSPEYMAGKHAYASSLTINLEPTVKAILSKDTK
jgi:hypothetical protein